MKIGQCLSRAMESRELFLFNGASSFVQVMKGSDKPLENTSKSTLET